MIMSFNGFANKKILTCLCISTALRTSKMFQMVVMPIYKRISYTLLSANFALLLKYATTTFYTINDNCTVIYYGNDVLINMNLDSFKELLVPFK